MGAAAEHGVVSFLQFLPVPDDVAAVVRFVGHHDDDGLAAGRLDPADNGPSESVTALVPDGMQLGDALFEALQHLPRAVPAAIVNDEDLVRDAVERQFEMKMLDGARDRRLFVTGGDDHAQALEWFTGEVRHVESRACIVSTISATVTVSGRVMLHSG